MMARRWRALIADDEPTARRGVHQLLASYSDFEVVGECRNGVEVLAALDELRPDVVFLDIRMPDLDGMEVIQRRTPELMPAVVFLTAHDEFAVNAFEADAVDYLLKPVSDSRFEAMIKRLRRKLAAPGDDSTLTVTTTMGVMVLALADVDWIESADNYARLWVGERSYLIRQSINELEEKMLPHGFVRAHRNALVRLDRIREVRTNGANGLVALLRSGAAVPVSRRRRAAFGAALRRRR